MKKRDKKNIFIFLSILLFIILYSTVITKYCGQYKNTLTTSFLLLLSFTTYILLGYKKDKPNKLKSSIQKIVLASILIYFIIIYVIGIFTSFKSIPYSLSLPNVMNYVLMPILIIIFSELLRYIIINANKDKNYIIIIITILFSLFEIVLRLNNYTFNDASSIFYFTTSCILPISIKNIVLSYLTYNGCMKTTIIYRILTEIYMYIIPSPDLENYLKSSIEICLPYLVYLYSSRRIKEYDDTEQKFISKSMYKKSDLLMYGGIIIIIILVSGVLPIYMMGIGSGSMEPVIYKGDAVIFSKVTDTNKLKVNDIVAYDNNGVIIVHRIIEIRENYVVTKGDSNKIEDTIPVAKNKIQGKYIFKIPYLAYPSVWFTEFVEEGEVNE